MISSYKALSYRYLKHNKKRTILTIIGIVMSIALICSIGTFMVSMRDTMYQQRIDSSGNYEVLTNSNLSKAQVDKIKDIKGVEFIATESDNTGENVIKDKQIKITNGDKTLFETLRVKLKEGTLPAKSDEVVLEDWILKYFDEKPTVGSEIKLMVNGKEGNYKVVGIADSKGMSSYLGIANAYVFNNNISADTENTTKYIKLLDGSDKRDSIDQIASIVGKDKIQENSDVLILSGESSNAEDNTAMFLIGGLVVGIVVIATIMVIYNAFNISIADRTRQFGQLRAMGTTRKQVIALVLKEAMIMVMISIPLGIFFGIGAVYAIAFTFNKLTPYLGLQVSLDPMIIIGSILIGVVSVYVSAILPAREAGKISPLVAISNSNLISKEKFKRNKKSKLSKRFKIDKVMAIKNVKRNKKRFYITATSIAISVTIFIAFMTFTKYVNAIQSDFIGSVKSEFEVIPNYEAGSEKPIPNSLINDIKKVDGIKEVYTNYKPIKLKSIVNENTVPKIVRDQNYDFIKDVKYNGETKKYLSVFMNGFEDNQIEALKKYVTSGSVDNLKENEVIVTGKDKMPSKDSPILTPVMDLKVGDEIQIDPNYYEKIKQLTPEEIQKNEAPKREENSKDSYNKGDLITVKVAAIVDNVPFYIGSPGVQKVILKKSNLEKIIANNKVAKEQYKPEQLYIDVVSKDKIDSIDTSLTKTIEKYPDFQLMNNQKNAEQMKKATMQITILLAGFLIVISLISSINIINTVSTNIIIRKRELASLKAIGMTSKELRNMICLEGAMFGLYGGVIGCVVGSLLSYAMSMALKSLREIPFEMPWQAIIISMIGVIAIGYLSALLPMRKLAKSNIIEGIKQD